MNIYGVSLTELYDNHKLSEAVENYFTDNKGKLMSAHRQLQILEYLEVPDISRLMVIDKVLASAGLLYEITDLDSICKRCVLGGSIYSEERYDFGVYFQLEVNMVSRSTSRVIRAVDIHQGGLHGLIVSKRHYSLLKTMPLVPAGSLWMSNNDIGSLLYSVRCVRHKEQLVCLRSEFTNSTIDVEYDDFIRNYTAVAVNAFQDY